MTCGIAGGVLGASLFADWYGADLSGAPEQVQVLTRQLRLNTTVDAWQAFGLLDILLAAAAVAGLLVAATTIIAPLARYGFAAAALASTLSTAGALICLVRVIDPPGSSATREAGAFFGLAAAIALCIASTVALRGATRAQP
jgi:hypothetical protein